MAEDRNKQKLIQLLERRVWNPVLKASPNKYSESDRKVLDRVQRKTEAQRERYRSYEGAGEVRQEYQDDLHSQQARKTNADLRKLQLPIQADVEEEFFEMADRLGVGPERQRRRHHEPHPPHPWHKSKPEERERAKQELKSRARKGDKAAIKTLESAPRRWARDYAEEVTAKKAPAKKKAAKRAAKKTTRKNTAARKKAAPARKKR